MQVSQPGLDPESPIFTMSFLNAVKDEMLAARNANLNVIVSVQDELQAGERNPVALPDEWARSMNAVIAVIRSTGSKNVIVADGLNYGETLKGAPLLHDPKGEVAYASHPYFHNESDQTEAAWNRKFGSSGS